MTTSFLDRLDAATADALLSRCRVRAWPARSLLFFEGDDAHDVLIVRDGNVKVFIGTNDGREVVLDVLGPGDLLGEMSAVDGGARSANATALGKVSIATVSLPAFNAFLAEHPAAAMALLASMTTRLRAASRRQAEFATVDALGRVCRRISELAARQPATARPLTVTAPLSQTELGAWAGLSREAVVKAFHALRSLGWISTDGRAITVLDPAAVRARADATLD